MDESDEFNEIMDIYHQLESTRYFNERTTVPKDDWLSKILFRYSNNDFKQIARMDKSSFVRVVDLIKHHRIFHNNSLRKQAPVWLQFLVVMQRLECDGNGASVGTTAKFNGISDGIVVIYTKRVLNQYNISKMNILDGQMSVKGKKLVNVSLIFLKTKYSISCFPQLV